MFSFRKIWKYLWPEMRKYKLSMCLVFAGYAFGVILDNVAKPLIYQAIVNIISQGEVTPQVLHMLLGLVVLAACAMLLYNVGYRTGDYSSSYFQSRVMKELHDSAFRRLLAHSYTFFSDNFSGSIIAKAKRLPKAFETVFDTVSWQIWFSLVTLVGILGVLFYQAPLLGCIFLAWAILYIVITILFVNKKIQYDMEVASADSSVTAYLSDTITNILNVKIFNRTRQEKENFSLRTDDEETKRRREWYFGSFQNAVQAVLMATLQVVVLVVAIRLWYAHRISVGMIVLLQAYMATLFDILWGLGRAIAKAMQSLTEMQEIVDIFEQTPDILDPAVPETLRIKEGHIAFEDVHFEYIDDHSVFKDFNLDIAPGERIGLVGHSGAGKSTITKLLLRFADVKSGAISIDGQDIRSVTQGDLRSMISYVPQESVLFHRTIAENILYARPDANLSEVIEVAKKAHAHEFISRLPNGYDTLVGERGIKLSGGERQRIAIARAMLKNAPILILDEATSSLDSVSEQYIQESFNELMKGKTTIVIAHRLSTIQKMDRIIVLENGGIAEKGTHQELLARDGIYADLWNHQMGGFIE